MRNLLFDVARGLAIVLVAIFHIVYRSENGTADIFLKESIWLVIPFFFIVSGYFTNVSAGNLLRDAINRLKRLLFPAVLCSVAVLILLGIYCAIFHAYDFRAWSLDVIATYLRPEFFRKIPAFARYDLINALVFDLVSPVWFVWTMALTIPVFYACARLVNLRKFWQVAIICAILLALTFGLYDYRNDFSWSLIIVPVYAAIMIFTRYLREAGLVEKILAYKNAYIFAVFAFAVHGAMFKTWGSSNIFMNEIGTVGKFSVFAFFVQVFVGAYVLLIFCEFLCCVRYLRKFLRFVGRNSLYFLLMHRFFAAIFSDLMGSYIKSGANWYVEFSGEVFVKSFVAFVLSMICCSVVVKFCEGKCLVNC